VVGGGTVARRTAHAGRHAGRLVVDDGLRRVRLVAGRSRRAQPRAVSRRAAIVARHLVLVVVVSRVVLVQCRRPRNTHDRRLRTRQSRQSHAASYRPLLKST